MLVIIAFIKEEMGRCEICVVELKRTNGGTSTLYSMFWFANVFSPLILISHSLFIIISIINRWF
jgi:hypothetical protein